MDVGTELKSSERSMCALNIMIEPVSGWKEKVNIRNGPLVVQCLFLEDISLSKGNHLCLRLTNMFLSQCTHN